MLYVYGCDLFVNQFRGNIIPSLIIDFKQLKLVCAKQQ